MNPIFHKSEDMIKKVVFNQRTEKEQLKKTFYQPSSKDILFFSQGWDHN